VRYNVSVTGWFQHVIVDPGRLRLFCFLVFFIVAFLFIRFSVRMIRAQVKWWPGNVASGGTHIHHVVFGLVFMCVGGISGLAVQDTRSVWAAITASLFGVGAALVLDEFALVLHLDDVYWSEEGRLSVQVVFIAIAVCGLGLLGLTPYEVTGDQQTPLGLALVLLFNLPFTVICLLKGKVWSGLLGIFISLFAIVGAIRLARPGSPWARSRYQPDGKKLARATARESRYRRPVAAALSRLADLLAGQPDRQDDDRLVFWTVGAVQNTKRSWNGGCLGYAGYSEAIADRTSSLAAWRAGQLAASRPSRPASTRNTTRLETGTTVLVRPC
jgi:hypothetical protein